MTLTIYNSDSYFVLDLPPGYRGIQTDFFQRFLTYYGIPILAPGGVDDFAIKEARFVLSKMFQAAEHRISDLCATNLYIAIVPEVQDGLFDFGLDTARIILVGEDNLTDRDAQGSIFIHEVGHAVHYACCEHEKQHIKTLYENRPFWGKTDAYGDKNEHEYFAEGVTAYFNAGMPGEPVHTRTVLQTFDPSLYHTIHAIFERNDWVWQPVSQRTVLTEHTIADHLTSDTMNDLRRI